MTFQQYTIKGLDATPSFWRVRPEAIIETCNNVSVGSVEKLAETPTGYPVFSVRYGTGRSSRGTATWAIGSSSRNLKSYKPEEDIDPQTVVLVCGVHGAEAEAVAGAMNLISLLESDHDLRGRDNAGLASLFGRYRLFILPCVNMDGRSVSPDHLRGASIEEFVRASQGVWNSGAEVGYPACKEYAPLPLDEVLHPGGYPNGDGYNIMHDITPGSLRTREAESLLHLVAEEAADLVIHFHSHSIGGQILPPPVFSYPFHAASTSAYALRVRDALQSAGLRPAEPHPVAARTGLNLLTACQIASGGLSVCFEQPAVAEWSFDEMIDTFFVVLETFLEHGLKEPFSPRSEVRKT